MSLQDRWSQLLADLRAQGRFRELTSPAGIDLSSNDYLGFGASCLSFRPRLPISGIASRLLRGHHAIWEEVESTLAHWHRAESALVMTSGYVANEGLLSTIIQRADWVASDALNHASIIDGLKLSRAERFLFRHQDIDRLEAGLQAASRNRSPERQLFIVTESLFGMEGDRTPLADIVVLAERYGAHVIVDEAHATGCLGPSGSGLVDAARLRSRVLATVHTGGKAIGVPGAYVCGSKLLRDLLVNRCRHFIFTTALPPAVGAWWLEAIARVQTAEATRTRLHEAAAVFRGALTAHGVQSMGRDYIVPIVIGDDAAAVAVAQRLQRQGYDIRPIRPPSVPEGTARLRIAIHADHDLGMLKEAVAAIAGALAEARG